MCGHHPESLRCRPLTFKDILSFKAPCLTAWGFRTCPSSPANLPPRCPFLAASPSSPLWDNLGRPAFLAHARGMEFLWARAGRGLERAVHVSRRLPSPRRSLPPLAALHVCIAIPAQKALQEVRHALQNTAERARHLSCCFHTCAHGGWRGRLSGPSAAALGNPQHRVQNCPHGRPSSLWIRAALG